MTELSPALERGNDKAPDAYRTISEVALELSLPQHVLRFWESRFAQIRPLKRGGGRRYYKPEDIALLKGIQHLLYNEGYTIKGVQKVLKTQGIRAVQNLSGAALRKIEFANDEEAQSAEVMELHEPMLEDLEASGQDNLQDEPGVDEPAIAELTPEIQAGLANQLPLFEPPVTGAKDKQQLAEFAGRLRAVRKDLVEIRETLKKADKQK